MLFTDNAVDLAGKRQAMVFIEDRLADHFAPLGFSREERNCPGRTDLATQGAIIFAVSQPGNNQRGIYALQSGLIYRWIQSILQADLHALATTDTFLQKIIFIPYSRWTQQT